MCGICGFLNYRDDALLKSMASSIAHRGPDEEGFYLSDRISLGSRRLKVIDLETGKQPVFNEDGSVVTVFNGEIYNFRELRGELVSKGHVFRTKTDTEVLVHLYEEYGEKMFAFLRGMFAFALWDIKKNVFLLARDHFGIKPVFYSRSGEAFFFASEIKALLRAERIPKDLDLRSLDDYFTCLYIPSPHTIYKNIEKLPPASYLIYKNGKAEVKKYWSFEKKENVKSVTPELLEKIENLLEESVKEQMVSDVPLGLFLSGGTDSSSILHFLKKNSRSRVKTFTISYEKEKDYDESGKAKMLSEYYGAEHENFSVKPDIIKIIRGLAFSFDQPFADSSAIITWLISKAARKHVTVALTGIGGDEIFGGYPRYAGFMLHRLYGKLPGAFKSLAYSFSQKLPESYGSANKVGRLKRFIKGGLYDQETAYKTWISSFDLPERKSLYTPDFTALAGGGYGLEGRVDGDKSLFEFELANYLEGDLLYMSDMASMMNSLELRVPFLDLRLVETMREIPLKLKMKNFGGKTLLKKIMKDKLPPGIMGIPKKGFQVPLSAWLSGELKDFVYDIISSGELKKSGYISMKNLELLFREHESKKRNLSDQIYSILIFELWRNSPSGAPGAGGYADGRNSPSGAPGAGGYADGQEEPVNTENK